MTFNQPLTQSTTRLHPATHMGAATLAVADLTRSVDFYTNVLGMRVFQQGDGKATLGAGNTPLLHLIEIPGARPQPDWSTGLYHAAILMPSRPDLGRVLINLARTQYPVGGFADHLVSEAIYLSDPDGNGLEIYRDRPRDEWTWDGTQVRMASDPIDLDGIIASVPGPDAPFAGMPDGTTMGHMHLRIGDIEKAEAFYQGIVGFDVVARWHSALFVSAGGYHHHLGLNTWHSRNAPPAPPDAVGLREYVIFQPNEDALNQLLARFDSAGIAYARQDGDVLVNDPWSNRLRWVVETA